MGDAKQIQLISAAQSSFLRQLTNVKETGDYHDLIISCESSKWKVHRVLEGETQAIDVKEDDPIMIDMLIKYLYAFDYDDESLPVNKAVADRDWWCNCCEISGHSSDIRCPNCNEELKTFSQEPLETFSTDLVAPHHRSR
ncbi:MAG: hypothetical protein Q9166_000772 [cf. Caloplaca sp. 2 TL-2023]